MKVKPISRRWLVVVACAALGLFLGATAIIVDAPLRSYKYRQVTGLSAVKDLSDNGSRVIPTGAHLAYIDAESQSIRWRDGSSDGSLTTRTDADTGVITVTDDDHGIADTDYVFVWWNKGTRYSMDVTNVTGNAITVNLGTGNNLPVIKTAVEIGANPTAAIGHLLPAGDNLWYMGPVHRFRMIETGASSTVGVTPYGTK